MATAVALPVAAPDRPGKPIAKGKGFGTAKVTVVPPAGGVVPAKYRVEAVEAPKPGCTVRSPETSCIVTGLDSKQLSYTFRAQAISADGDESPWSVASAPTRSHDRMLCSVSTVAKRITIEPDAGEVTTVCWQGRDDGRATIKPFEDGTPDWDDTRVVFLLQGGEKTFVWQGGNPHKTGFGWQNKRGTTPAAKKFGEAQLVIAKPPTAKVIASDNVDDWGAGSSVGITCMTQVQFTKFNFEQHDDHINNGGKRIRWSNGQGFDAACDAGGDDEQAAANAQEARLLINALNEVGERARMTGPERLQQGELIEQLEKVLSTKTPVSGALKNEVDKFLADVLSAQGRRNAILEKTRDIIASFISEMTNSSDPDVKPTEQQLAAAEAWMGQINQYINGRDVLDESDAIGIAEFIESLRAELYANRDSARRAYVQSWLFRMLNHVRDAQIDLDSNELQQFVEYQNTLNGLYTANERMPRGLEVEITAWMKRVAADDLSRKEAARRDAINQALALLVIAREDLMNPRDPETRPLTAAQEAEYTTWFDSLNGLLTTGGNLTQATALHLSEFIEELRVQVTKDRETASQKETKALLDDLQAFWNSVSKAGISDDEVTGFLSLSNRLEEQFFAKRRPGGVLVRDIAAFKKLVGDADAARRAEREKERREAIERAIGLVEDVVLTLTNPRDPNARPLTQPQLDGLTQWATLLNGMLDSGSHFNEGTAKELNSYLQKLFAEVYGDRESANQAEVQALIVRLVNHVNQKGIDLTPLESDELAGFLGTLNSLYLNKTRLPNALQREVEAWMDKVENDDKDRKESKRVQAINAALRELLSLEQDLTNPRDPDVRPLTPDQQDRIDTWAKRLRNMLNEGDSFDEREALRFSKFLINLRDEVVGERVGANQREVEAWLTKLTNHVQQKDIKLTDDESDQYVAYIARLVGMYDSRQRIRPAFERDLQQWMDDVEKADSGRKTEAEKQRRAAINGAMQTLARVQEELTDPRNPNTQPLTEAQIRSIEAWYIRLNTMLDDGSNFTEATATELSGFISNLLDQVSDDRFNANRANAELWMQRLQSHVRVNGIQLSDAQSDVMMGFFGQLALIAWDMRPVPEYLANQMTGWMAEVSREDLARREAERVNTIQGAMSQLLEFQRDLLDPRDPDVRPLTDDQEQRIATWLNRLQAMLDEGGSFDEREATRLAGFLTSLHREVVGDRVTANQREVQDWLVRLNNHVKDKDIQLTEAESNEYVALATRLAGIYDARERISPAFEADLRAWMRSVEDADSGRKAAKERERVAAINAAIGRLFAFRNALSDPRDPETRPLTANQEERLDTWLRRLNAMKDEGDSFDEREALRLTGFLDSLWEEVRTERETANQQQAAAWIQRLRDHVAEKEIDLTEAEANEFVGYYSRLTAIYDRKTRVDGYLVAELNAWMKKVAADDSDRKTEAAKVRREAIAQAIEQLQAVDAELRNPRNPNTRPLTPIQENQLAYYLGYLQDLQTSKDAFTPVEAAMVSAFLNDLVRQVNEDRLVGRRAEVQAMLTSLHTFMLDEAGKYELTDEDGAKFLLFDAQLVEHLRNGTAPNAGLVRGINEWKAALRQADRDRREARRVAPIMLAGKQLVETVSDLMSSRDPNVRPLTADQHERINSWSQRLQGMLDDKDATFDEREADRFSRFLNALVQEVVSERDNANQVEVATVMSDLASFVVTVDLNGAETSEYLLLMDRLRELYSNKGRIDDGLRQVIAAWKVHVSDAVKSRAEAKRIAAIRGAQRQLNDAVATLNDSNDPNVRPLSAAQEQKIKDWRDLLSTALTNGSVLSNKQTVALNDFILELIEQVNKDRETANQKEVGALIDRMKEIFQSNTIKIDYQVKGQGLWNSLLAKYAAKQRLSAELAAQVEAYLQEMEQARTGDVAEAVRTLNIAVADLRELRPLTAQEQTEVDAVLSRLNGLNNRKEFLTQAIVFRWAELLKYLRGTTQTEQVTANQKKAAAWIDRLTNHLKDKDVETDGAERKQFVAYIAELERVYDAGVALVPMQVMRFEKWLKDVDKTDTDRRAAKEAARVKALDEAAASLRLLLARFEDPNDVDYRPLTNKQTAEIQNYLAMIEVMKRNKDTFTEAEAGKLASFLHRTTGEVLNDRATANQKEGLAWMDRIRDFMKRGDLDLNKAETAQLTSELAELNAMVIRKLRVTAAKRDQLEKLMVDIAKANGDRKNAARIHAAYTVLQESYNIMLKPSRDQEEQYVRWLNRLRNMLANGDRITDADEKAVDDLIDSWNGNVKAKAEIETARRELLAAYHMLLKPSRQQEDRLSEWMLTLDGLSKNGGRLNGDQIVLIERLIEAWSGA